MYTRHFNTYLYNMCSLISNMDMIKISHVMTIYTNKYVYAVYNFVFNVYNIMIVRSQ